MMAFAEIIQIIRENAWLSGVSLLGILSFFAVLFREGLLYEYKRFREGGDDSADKQVVKWYRKTASLARQVQRIWESKCVEPRNRGEHFSYEEVQGEMGLLADQLDRHATSHQDSVPPELMNLIYETAQECRSVEHVMVGIGSNQEFWDQGELAVEKAEELEEAAEHRLKE